MSGEGGGASEGGLLLNQPIVIDNGTCSIKTGFAGSSKPKVILNTQVGRVKHMRVMPGGALEQEDAGSSSGSSKFFVGRKLQEHRGAFLLEHPMADGIVQGWDAMEVLWEHIYSKHCLNAKQEEHPVLLTEAPLNPRSNRIQMAEVWYETLRAPALHWTAPAVLSLYASGRTTGVVLDVGEGVTHAVPVYEGLALQHSVTRSHVAGRAVTAALQRALRRSAGLNLTTTAEVDYVRQVKQDVCYLTPTPTDDAAAATTQYQLPDGQVVTLGRERFQAPSILFDPMLMGSEEPGAADVLCNAIAKSDLELRPKLWQQVVVSGGTTLTAGFGDRLLAESKSRAPAHARLRISAPPDRLTQAFTGGSILASLATFNNLVVTRAQYEEHGERCLFRGDL
mmetsp:Transcript_3900/g.7756  ORF Transcript_3900/g.7756 Transcript_3900/m.7756 type:complete len:394 (-) Transcript_3900:16-1197(-)